MIKFVLAAVWISAASIAAVFYSFQMSQAGDDTSRPAFFGGLDYVRTEIISVPVVREGAVRGYFLARLAYTVEPEVLDALTVPAETLLVDQIYTHLYANPQIDYTDRESINLETFKSGLRESINERVGNTLIHEVLVEQIDFLSKEEIRDNTIRRRIGPADE